MGDKLAHKKIAILVADGFEESELTKPQQALIDEGATTYIISPSKGIVRGWTSNNWGDEFMVDVPLKDANPDDYDALLLPGGVMNPDKLRRFPEAVAFVKDFFSKNKPVAAICHGPWMLVEADVVKDRKITSFSSIKTDIVNAGGNWVDMTVVVDGNLVTSRKPDDIPAFNEQMIKVFSG